MHKELDRIEAQASHEWRVYEAALWYVEQGIFLLPLMKNSKKLPPKESGISYTSASRKKTTIKKWFDPDNGVFRGGNIGIACGKEDGVFAIDLDRHGEEDGIANWKRLMVKENGELNNPCVQLTPSGGQHLLFKWEENARSGTNTFGVKGIDTRGGLNNASKGHIVAFPSMVDGAMYNWKYWGEVPVIPEWITKLLGTATRFNSGNGPGRGNEMVSADDVEEVLDVEQIARMLEFIDPNDCDYDKWLRVGLAIKSQYPDEIGLEIWDTWSKGGERYKNSECYIRWEGFADFGTVRAGTLFYYATEGGWEQEAGERRGNRFDSLVAEMNETYAIVTIGGKIRVLRQKANPYEMDMHYDLLDKDSFKTLLENQTFIVTMNGKQKTVPISAIWLAHEGRLTYENGMGLFPDDVVPKGYYNTWSGFSVEPKEGNCKLFLDHIRHIICDDEDFLYEWVLDWLADLFQDPADPKGCALVMRGEEGSGKGVLANTIGSMFGPHHRHLIDDAHLTSNFNAHLLDAVTVFADEITWGGNLKSAGKLKGMVTERYLVGERKGIDAILYRNMVHLMIASNSDWVIPAGTNSRRWCVLDVPNQMCTNRKYFNALHKEIDNGGKEAILHFLLNREITNDLRRAPETKGLMTQRLLNVQNDSVFQWWRKSIIAGKIPVSDIDKGEVDWPNKVHKMELYENYEEHTLARRGNPVAENVFAKKMHEYGASQSRVRAGKTRARVYILPIIAKASDIMNTIIPGAIQDEEDTDKPKGRSKRKRTNV